MPLAWLNKPEAHLPSHLFLPSCYGPSCLLFAASLVLYLSPSQYCTPQICH